MMYQEPNATLYQGHVLDVLKGLPSGSVDMVMTSPPYYSLRSYKAEQVIWGGDENCLHEWGDGHLVSVGRNDSERKWKGTAPSSSSSSCLKCNAWRGQLGLEPDPDMFIDHLMMIFDEVKRVLKKTGTIWVNLDDSYAGSWGNMSHKSDKDYPEGRPPHSYKMDTPAKSLLAIPERFVLAMMKRGWIRRNTIIWKKDSVMPESVKDRFTNDFEYLYMFSQSQKYYFDQQFEPHSRNWTNSGGNIAGKGQHKYVDGWRDPTDSHPNAVIPNPQGRNMRAVWTINPESYSGEHYAVYPTKLCRTPILTGCPPGGTVLDPFAGTGTTGFVAKELGRKFIGIELSESYCKQAVKRLQKARTPLME